MPTFFKAPRPVQVITAQQISTSGGTTLVNLFSGATKPQVGDTIIVYGSRDDAASEAATPTGDSFSDGTANTYSKIVGGSDVTDATVGDGCVGVMFHCLLTNAWAGGTNTLTWTMPNVTTKVMRIEHYVNVGALRASAIGTSAAGAPSATLSTPLAGDLLLGMCAFENSGTQTETADSDTVGGPWSTITRAFTGSSSNATTALTHQKVVTQNKIRLTASGSQTYSVTNSNTTNVDSVAIIAAFEPVTSSIFDPLSMIPWVEAHWASDPAWTPPANGAEVTSWRDGSENSRPLITSAGQGPTFESSVVALNSKPAINFDGVNDRLRNTAAYTQAQPFTVVTIVADWDVSIANARLFGASSDNVQIFAEGGGWANSFTIYAGTNTPELIENDTGPNAYVTVFNGLNSQTVKDGVNSRLASTQSDPGSSSITSGPTLGMRDSQTSPGHFRCAFMGVYNGDFRNDISYADFAEWVASFYALPYPTPAQNLGSAIGTSADTTTSITFSSPSKPRVGDFVAFYGSRDSLAGDAVTDSFSDGAGNTYTVETHLSGTGATGVVAVLAYSKITTEWSAGDNTLIWTHPSVAGRSLIADHWKGIKGLRAGSVAKQALTSGASTTVNSSTIVANDVVLACVAAEYGSDVAPTVIDTDVGSGAWSSIRFKGNGTASDVGVKVASQWKVVSADGYQEWNVGGFGATTNVEVAAILAAFEPTTAATSPTPIAIAGVGTLSAPTISATGITAPTAIAGVGSFAAPTISIATAVAPTAIVGVGSFAVPTISTSGIVTPTAINGVGTLSVATLSATGNVSPVAIVGVGSFGLPTLPTSGTGNYLLLQGGFKLLLQDGSSKLLLQSDPTTPTPPAIVGIGSFGGLTISTTGRSAPNAIAGAGIFGLPTVSASGTATPGAINGVGSFGATTIQTSASVSTPPLIGVSVFGPVAISATGRVDVSALTGVGVFGQPTVSTTRAVALGALQGVGALGTPSLAASGAASPAPLLGSGSFPLATPQASGSVAPAAIQGVGSFGTVSISTTGAGSTAPTAIVGIGTLGSVTINATGNVPVQSISGLGSFSTPSISSTGVANGSFIGIGTFSTPSIQINEATNANPVAINGVGSFGTLTLRADGSVVVVAVQGIGSFGQLTLVPVAIAQPSALVGIGAFGGVTIKATGAVAPNALMSIGTFPLSTAFAQGAAKPNYRIGSPQFLIGGRVLTTISTQGKVLTTIR